MFLEEVVGKPAHLLGCSDGASLALIVALRRPDLVVAFWRWQLASSTTKAGTTVFWTASPPISSVSATGKLSPDGADHYRVVVAKLAAMHADEPALTSSDLRRLEARTLLLFADDDEVRWEHVIRHVRAHSSCRAGHRARNIPRALGREACPVQPDHRPVSCHRAACHSRAHSAQGRGLVIIVAGYLTTGSSRCPCAACPDPRCSIPATFDARLAGARGYTSR